MKKEVKGVFVQLPLSGEDCMARGNGMSEELKSCPFCGGSASFGRVEYPEHQEPFAWFADGSPVIVAHNVNCQMCGANNKGFAGGYQTQAQAAEKWNTRAGEKV